MNRRDFVQSLSLMIGATLPLPKRAEREVDARWLRQWSVILMASDGPPKMTDAAMRALPTGMKMRVLAYRKMNLRGTPPYLYLDLTPPVVVPTATFFWLRVEGPSMPQTGPVYIGYIVHPVSFTRVGCRLIEGQRPMLFAGLD